MSKDIKDGKDIRHDDLLLEPEQREEYLLLQKVPGVCRYGKKGKWRAYLHIKEKQVWQKSGFETKSEAVDARREAEQRFGKTEKRETVVVTGSLPKSPRQTELFEGVRIVEDGMYEAFRYVEAPADAGEKRFVEEVLGVYEDYGLAVLHARASVAEVPFDELFFVKYLEMHEQVEKLKRDMHEFAQSAILPLLRLSRQAKPRRVEHCFLGYRWQQVRRYKKVTWKDDNLTVHTQKQLSGVHLRIVKDKEVE